PCSALWGPTACCLPWWPCGPATCCSAWSASCFSSALTRPDGLSGRECHKGGAAGASKEARTRSGRPTMNEGCGPLQLVASLFRRLAVLLAAVMVFGGAARAAEPVSVTAREYSL